MQSRAAAFAVLMTLATVALAADPASEDPKTVIAAQIRDQGYKCDAPQSAVQDMQASKPDEAVWVIACEDASYRVRLDPDMAAKVERIGKDKGADQ